MLTFAAAAFFLMITPGPGVLSAAAVGAGFGFRAGLRYVAGLFVGSTLVSLAVASSLAAVLLANPVTHSVLLFLSLGYLVFLAARIALSGSRFGFAARLCRPGALDGILLQVLNPKVYVVSTALFSGFAFLAASIAAEVAVKLLIINLIWLPVHLLWLWMGVVLHRLDLSDTANRILRVTMACAMLAVVALALLDLL